MAENWYSKYYKEKAEKKLDEFKSKKPAEKNPENAKLSTQFKRELQKYEKPATSRYLEFRKKEKEMLERAKGINHDNYNGKEFEKIGERNHYPRIEEVKNYPEIEEVKKNPESRDTKYFKAIKIIILIIPLIIIFYLLYSNFLASQEFHYFYDIGGNKNYLSPVQRITEKIQENELNYRNLTAGLVYFNIEVPRGSEKIKIETRFKDNFPNNSIMTLGAKDQEVWHYTHNSLYNPSLNNISEFMKKDNVYLVNQKLYPVTYEELKYERDVVIAIDKTYNPLPNLIYDYEIKETIINTSLRSGHVFYIYAKGDLKLEVKKQDINWYEDSDELEISLYDSDNNLIANTIIPDDGVVNVSREHAPIQSAILDAMNLLEGVYKLEFSNFDGLIREIKINTNKIVSKKLFLADNELYGIDTKPSKIYTKISRPSQINFITYHSNGIQNITYYNKTFVFDREDASLYLNLTEGEYEFLFPKNDLAIYYPGYFSFSKQAYFEPFRQEVIGIPRDIEWLKNNIDYLVTNYQPPKPDNGWMIASSEFSIKENKLFVKDGKLSMVFNIPHLGNEQYLNNTIPIDWINITVYKPGLFDRFNKK